jgi:MOSC domain-containing protein YiiM
MGVGVIDQLFLKPGHRKPMMRVATLTLVAGKGIKNDSAFGRKRRQVLLIDREVLESFEISPGELRENITTSGLALSQLEPGMKIQIASATLEVVGECTPCSRVDEVRPGLQGEIIGQRGVLARVLQGGQISRGDRIRIEPPSSHNEDGQHGSPN